MECGGHAAALTATAWPSPGAFERLAPFFYDRGHFSDEPAPRSDAAHSAAAVVVAAIAGTMRAR